MTVTPIAVRRVVVCTLLLFGCSGTEPSQNQKPSFVTVSAEADMAGAVPGVSIQFTATAYDSAREPIPGARFEWATADTFLATVNANGLVTAHHPGLVRITARMDTLEAGITFTVLEPVASVLLRGVRAPLTPGAVLRLPFVLRSAAGDSLATYFRSLRWSSSQESVARVDSDGIISTVGPGATTLTLSAAVEGVAASVELSVAALDYRTAQDAGQFTCGLTTGKRIYCWGPPYTGLQPDGTDLLGITPWPLDTDVLFDSLRAGSDNACALTHAGEPWCWGSNDNGQLGDGTTTSRFTPQPVAGGLILKSIVPGIHYTCGLLLDGSARCWGWNEWGNFGTGDRESSLLPRESAAGIQFRTISVSPDIQIGGPHTCGMSLAGDAYCWGANEFGQLATYPRTQISHSPTLVLSPTPLVEVQSGGQHSCGLAADETVFCWGDNQGNSLGDREQYPGMDSIAAPVADAPPFTQVRTGLYRSCGLTPTGDVYCWGDVYGKKPVRINIPQPLSRVDVSLGKFCGMSVQGVAYCWTASLVATKVEGQT